jgi:chemotaxis protein CheX
MISVPIIVQGSANAIQVPRNVKAYIIPLRWHKHEAALVVSLQ